MLKMRLWPGLRPRPHWGSSRRSPRPPSRLGRGISPPQTSPTRRFWHLDLTHRLRRLDSRACDARFSIPAVPVFETFRRPWILAITVILRHDRDYRQTVHKISMMAVQKTHSVLFFRHWCMTNGARVVQPVLSFPQAVQLFDPQQAKTHFH